MSPGDYRTNHGPLQWYGFEFADKIGVPETPIKESNPRIPDSYASNVMYYAQYDMLQKLSRNKKWSFAEVRPDGVVSHSLFPPKPSFLYGPNTALNSPVSFLLVMP
jgi:hypothetical protein